MSVFIFVAVVTALAYFLAPSGGRNRMKLSGMLSLSPRDLFGDIRAAWGIVTRNRWLFLLPFGAYLLDFIYQYTLYLIFSPGISGEMYASLKANQVQPDLVRFLKSIPPHIETYMYKAYSGVHTEMLLIIALPAILFQRKFGAWLDRNAGAGIWPGMARHFTVTYLMLLTALGIFLLIATGNDPETSSLIYMNAMMVVPPLLQLPFAIAVASFFEGGIISSMALLASGGTVTPQNFLKKGGEHFRQLFWLNMALMLGFSILPQLIGSTYYDDARGYVSLNPRPYFQALGPLFMAAPFLVVLHGRGALNALTGSLAITLRHLMEFLVIFVTGGVLLSLGDLVRSYYLGFLFPYLPGDMAPIILSAGINIFISCLIAVVFLLTLRRVMGEEFEEHLAGFATASEDAPGGGQSK